jgi:hypothetical protein
MPLMLSDLGSCKYFHKIAPCVPDSSALGFPWNGRRRGLSYRLLAGVDGNTGGEERLFGESKLPLGGSNRDSAPT